MNPSERFFDFLVIGGGVAGLSAAIELASKGSVAVLTKDRVTESSTEYAQGGIAVAMSDEDQVGIHYEDTIKAGDGLCNEEAVRIMVEEGPRYIRELISWGAEFDREGTKLSFSQEAAHTRKRILHAHGDSTGKEIERVLIHKAKAFASITKFDFAFTLDLIMHGNHCTGAILLRRGSVLNIRAKAVILATGGAGQIFSRTTTPLITTGDGIAIAYRTGAHIMDMEFIQFHPTTLFFPGAPQFLLSEAMRGEGAVLRNIHWERFMPEYHKLAELAPRDSVSRAIVSEMVRTKASHVYLDLSHMDKDFVKNRFPRIYATCMQYDLDITEDRIPVCPSAHYTMGGVSTTVHGETNITGLFAAGEVACTGVHGANRLASNSLLEGLVFGARAGEKAASYIGHKIPESAKEKTSYKKQRSNSHVYDPEKVTRFLRQLMWNKAGIIRCRKSLMQAKKWLEMKRVILKEVPARDRRGCELKNMLTVASLITDSALLREGSVGAHYRSNYKNRGKDWQKHVVCEKRYPAKWVEAYNPKYHRAKS